MSGLRIDRRHQRQFVVHVVEDREQRRPHHQRLPARRSRRGSSPAASPSAAPCRSRDSRPARPPSAAGSAGTSSRVSSISARRLSSAGRVSAHERVRRRLRVAVDLGLAVAAAPDQVRLHADDRVAPARRAALDALQQERVRPAVRQLQERGDRRFQIGHAASPHQRAAPRVVGGHGSWQSRAGR